jgi:hypothetical protein
VTQDEAQERADLIWPGEKQVRLREDGSADIEVLVNVKGTPFYYHRLDGFGHTVCHGWCAQLEKEIST